MEICPDQAVDQLFRARVHPAPALQHHPHRGLLHEPGHQVEEVQEAVRQVQGDQRGPAEAPGHHEVYRQEVRLLDKYLDEKIEVFHKYGHNSRYTVLAIPNGTKEVYLLHTLSR